MGQGPSLLEFIKLYNCFKNLDACTKQIRKPSLSPLSAEYQFLPAEASTIETPWIFCLTWVKRDEADVRRLKWQQYFWGLKSSAQLGEPLVAKAWPLISRVCKLTRQRRTQNHCLGFGREPQEHLIQPPTQRESS